MTHGRCPRQHHVIWVFHIVAILWLCGPLGTLEYAIRRNMASEFGHGGYTTVLMQVHWNNPELRDDHMDTPGMSLHLTKNLRENDAGIIQLGTNHIFIPGGVDDYTTEGICSQECTQNIPTDINVDQVILHMHYLGEESGFYHSRDGVLQNSIFEPYYSYDNPKIYRFDQALTFKPGDVMSVTCKFDTTSKPDEVTKFGDGTSDEMCYAFVVYYPKIPELNYCMSFKSLDFCPVGSIPAFPNCDIMTFLTDQDLQAYIFVSLHETCNKPGASPEACPEGCQELVEDLRANNTCLQGDVGFYMESVIYAQDPQGMQIAQMMHTCDPDWDPELMAPRYVPPPDNNTKNKAAVLDTDSSDDDMCVFDKGPSSAGRQLTASAFFLAVCVFVKFY